LEEKNINNGIKSDGKKLPRLMPSSSSGRRSARRMKPRIKCTGGKFLAYSGREQKKHESSNIETEIY